MNTDVIALGNFEVPPRQALQEGWRMAEKEGDSAFQSIELLHAAEVQKAKVEVISIEARGHVLLRLLDTIERKLVDLGFSISQHLQDMACGRLDLIIAVALSVINAALALFVVLAMGPKLISIVLAFVILGSVSSIEEFFEAYSDGHVVREAIFFATSVFGLAGQYWLGIARGKLMIAVAAAGPISHLLSQAGSLIQCALAVLAVAVEVLCGWKLFRARTTLLSATARSFRESERINAQLSELARVLECTKTLPDVNRHYRTIGARQQIAWAKGAEQRAKANHLTRAVKGAAIALLVIGILLLLAGQMFAAPALGQTKVALLDLSKSVSHRNFQASVECIAELIAHLDVRDRLIVVPITDRFRNSVLFDETMPSDAGYLGLHSQATREEIGAKWRKVSDEIGPVYNRTDIFGALTVVSYLGSVNLSGVKIFIFSDLQQSAPPLDLEHLNRAPDERDILKLKRMNAIPMLGGAVVYAIGVDPLGKDTRSYTRLHDFWILYFPEAGAELRLFSVNHASTF